MTMRQPARLSPTPAYGLPDVAVESERSHAPSAILPLLILVIGLAVVTVWFVALPAFSKPLAKRSCEVVVLKSGSTRCVPAPTHASRGLVKKSSTRAKH